MLTLENKLNELEVPQLKKLLTKLSHTYTEGALMAYEEGLSILSTKTDKNEFYTFCDTLELN